MQENNQEFLGLIHNIVNNAKVTASETTSVALTDLLQPQQIVDLCLQIVSKLPENNAQKVKKFQEAFKVPKEDTIRVQEFVYRELRLALILEEAMELGKALGFSNEELYVIVLTQYKKIKEKEIEPGLIEVADALSDLKFVTYGAEDVFNLTSIQHEIMTEVTDSNMSKLIPKTGNFMDVVKRTVDFYKEQGIEIVTEDCGNYFIVKNKETNKILKSVDYRPADLKPIINKLNS